MVIILFLFSLQKALESPNQFVPQNHAMILIPITIPPSFPIELPSVIIPLPPGIFSATESSLNADVPEFQPRNHIPRVTGNTGKHIVTGKHINFSDADESNMHKNSSMPTESRTNDIEKYFVTNSANRFGTDDSEKKSKEIPTDTEKRSSQLYPKVDLEVMYQKSVKSSTNTDNSNNNRNRNSSWNGNNNEIDSIENSPSNSSNIDTMTKKKNSDNLTSKRPADPKGIFVKSEVVTAKHEIRPNGRRTYAQILNLIDTKSNLCVPIQADLRNHSSLKPTSECMSSSKVEQFSKLNSKLDTITPSNFVGIDVPEWHMVRSKCRKKNFWAKENCFERNVNRSNGAEADITTNIASLNENDKELQNTGGIGHSCPTPPTKSRAYPNVPKNSKPPFKSKKKCLSKKNQIKTRMEKFNIREPDFTREIDTTDFGTDKVEQEIEEVPIISSNEILLYPAMFSSELPLLVQTPLTSASTLRRQAVEAGLVGLKKCGYNGRQELRIFRHENDSENILLKKEEEMVIRVLEQLNINDKSEKIAEETKDAIEQQNEKRIFAHVENTSLDKDANDWDADRFSINAKPYQNLYTSNHFLGHFFGDNNDKCSSDMRPFSLISIAHNGNKFIEKREESSTRRNIDDSVPVYDDSEQDPIKGEPNTGKPDQLNLGKSLNHFERTNSSVNRIIRSTIPVKRSLKEPVESIVSMIQNHESMIFEHIETKFSQNMTNDKHFEYKYSSNGSHLRIVDTETLEKQKKSQRTFPLTAAVSHWFSQMRKEKAPDSALRMPIANCQNLSAKLDSHALQDNADVYLIDKSINNEENIQRPQNCIWSISTDHSEHEYIGSDSEGIEDSTKYIQLNALPLLLTPTQPTHVYGRRINYANKKNLLCNDTVNADANDKLVVRMKSDQMTFRNSATSGAAHNNIFANSPSVYCIIM